MLTPSFNLSQNDNFLLLSIKAPYSKVSETEIHFEGTDFHFYSKPYFLRLVFPGLVSETGSETATYNVDEGSFSIQIPKASPGEWFEGLDLQTRLLAPRGKVTTGPMIQVLDSRDCDSEVSVSNEDEDEFQWEIYQNQYTEEEENEDVVMQRTVKYGFASLKTDTKLFSRLQEEMPDLLDVHVQNHSTVLQRRRDRIKRETEDFSEDHYLADLYESDEIARLVSYKAWWSEVEDNTIGDDSLSSEKMVFSEKENAKMRSLPNKEYLLDQATKQEVLLNLVDILFAYGYNVRTTEGENTVESAWTICKLSSTLSWLETFSSLESVLVSSVRRSLCYPLYRQWKLAMTVLDDTAKILSLGPKFVLKCLLEIHDLFNESDPRYILNDLYITDYCVWIQTVKFKVLSDLAEAIKKVSVSKLCVDLELVELEQAADLVVKTEEPGNTEEKSVENISNKFCELKLQSATSEIDLEASESGTSDDEDSSSSSSDQLSQREVESSDSDTSDDESSSSLDSDDYSSSDNYDSSDDDSDDSDANEGNAENCLLLGNFHSIEKIR